MNTGSPDSPERADVRRFLGRLLMDPHVIDLPWPLRALLVKGIIAPRRAARSAKAYKKIWMPEGSPLIHHCTQIRNRLAAVTTIPLEQGMAWGRPSVREGVGKLLEAGVEEISVLPMFPQSAAATTQACLAKVKKELAHRGSSVQATLVPPFYFHPLYVKGLADSLADVEEHILFSFHGLPERQVKKQPAPDYLFQCLETARLVIAQAGLPETRISISFQSQMGRGKWLRPYTAEVLRKLPAIGKTKLAVICPSFFCDCLETLEEIGVRGREIFLSAGGKSFRLIPCLNSSPAAISLLRNLIKTHCTQRPPFPE